MKKMSRESAIEMIIDYSIDYEHYLDAFQSGKYYIIKLALIKDNPKDVADKIYDTLYSDKKFLKMLNDLDYIVKLEIYNPYNYKTFSYEM